MIKISENFKLLQTPLAAVMLPTVTLKKASERGEVELNTLIEKIKELIKTYQFQNKNSSLPAILLKIFFKKYF